MPRHPRLFVPHMPLHIVQRGHNRRATFVQPRDYRYYLKNLQDAKEEFSVKVFAYCLMTNHVHLVIAPGPEADNVSRLMRVLAARQTRYVNTLEKRTGTLWDGRFKSSLVDSDNYLLTCLRYVDLNPTRAGIVAAPRDYRWSSYEDHTEFTSNEWLDECAPYHALGSCERERKMAYKKMVANRISDDELALIRTSLQRNQVTGSDTFRKEVASRLHRRISALPPGRPPRQEIDK